MNWWLFGLSMWAGIFICELIFSYAAKRGLEQFELAIAEEERNPAPGERTVVYIFQPDYDAYLLPFGPYDEIRSGRN